MSGIIFVLESTNGMAQLRLGKSSYSAIKKTLLYTSVNTVLRGSRYLDHIGITFKIVR